MRVLKLICMVLPPPGRFWNAYTTSALCVLTPTRTWHCELVIEQFFSDNLDLVAVCQEASNEMEDACAVANKSTRPASVQRANAHLLHTLTQGNVMKRLQDWEAQKAQNAMFRFLMNYLRRVETILYFVAASQNADLNLHLQAGEALSKLFFAMDTSDSGHAI